MQKSFIDSDYRPLLWLFLGLASGILILSYMLPDSGINYSVLHAGNLLLFIVGWISVRMNIRALKHKTVQGFLRLVYGSFILKFFILAIVAFIYIARYRKDLNKPALFGCFGLYFIYTVVELRSVMKKSKKSNA